MKKKLLLILLSISMLAAAAIGLTACGDVIDSALDQVNGDTLTAPQNVAYDGTYITWSKVNKAEYYMVKIGNKEAVRSNSTTYYYLSTGEAFDVTVSAVEGDKQESTSVTFKPLPTIETLTVSEDGTLSWNPVTGATAYQLSINGSVIANDVVDTIYSQLPAGSNRVKVKPIVSGDSSYYSFWSEERSIYIYSPPTDMSYDGTTLSWKGNSASYEVNINGKISIVNSNYMDYVSNNKDFSVTIKAIGNHTSTFDSKTYTDEFHYLDTVKDIKITDGIATWDEIAGADGYKIRVNGVIQSNILTEPSYDKLAAGSTHEIQVMPYKKEGNYFSSWSAEKTVFILEAPTVSWNNDLELDGEANNNFTWNSVNVAGGYTVKLTANGKEQLFNFSDVQRAFAYAYSEVGKYTVAVKANAPTDSADYYDSAYSEVYTIERLASPKAASQSFIVSDKNSLAQGFTVNFIAVAGVSGYQLYKDGALVDGKTTTGTSMKVTNVVESSELSEQHITYSIRSTGSYNASQRYVKLPSLSTESLSFDITVLASPQALTMSGYNLSWTGSSNSNGYTVNYGGNSYAAENEVFDLSILSAGSYDVRVCARGNGSNVLASNFSPAAVITRIQAPTNIKITSEGNGTLTWNDVSNAKGYQAYLDLSDQALDASAYGNMYQFIETNGTTLHMIAVANYYNEEGTIYYMSSVASPTQQFIRLATPEFPEGVFADSNYLVWNAPSNINTAEYTPTYRIYSMRDEQIGGGDVNSTKFDISYLEGGRSYTFLVKAIGNDSKYLDSDYSMEITVYKLATPEIRFENGKYVWDSIVNASSYYMEIDGEKVTAEFHVSGTTYSYTPLYKEVGTHKVTLKAIGDKRNNLDSSVYTYLQEVKLLQAPEVKYSYSADSFVTGGSIIVEIVTPSQYANKYQYEIAGESIVTGELSCSKIIQTSGTYTIRVKALGGSFDENGTYYVDSQYAGGNNAYKLTLLGQPSGFSINSDGVIKWNNVQSAYGYEYQISYDGQGFSETTYNAYSSLNPIENYKQFKTITIRVRAKGNGSNTVTSDWSEWTWTNIS